MNNTGRIRRIVIGQNIKDGMSFHVGQVMNVAGKTITIKEIVYENDVYDFLGISRYTVYCQKEGETELVPFKSTENMSVFLEYDLND